MAASRGIGNATQAWMWGQRRRTANNSEAPNAAEGDSTPTVSPATWVKAINGNRRS
jgi:hypothetical protein